MKTIRNGLGKVLCPIFLLILGLVSFPATAEPVSLTWYFPGNWPQPDQDLVFAEVNKILEAKINVNVKFVPVSFGDYDAKMKLVIASGENFDICFTAPWINNYAQNVAKGAYLPLDDLLAKNAPKRFSDLKNYWDAAKIKGKIYGFINEQIFARTAAVAVEKAWADKYNFDSYYKVGDLSSLTPYMAAMFKDNPKFYGGAVRFSDVPELFNMEFVNGGSSPVAVLLDDVNTKTFNYFENPNFKKYVAQMVEFTKKGYSHASEFIGQKRDDSSGWTEHRLMFSIGGTYKPGIDADLTGRYGFPVIARPFGTPVITTSGVIATMMAVSRTSKSPDKAVQLLELVNTDQKIWTLLNYGIEGSHYTLDKGFMNLSPDSKYNPNVPWMFANQFLALPLKGQSADVWEQTRKINQTAKKSVLLGFTFDAEPVKSEVAKCAAVIDQAADAITLGLYNDAQYKEFLDRLKKAGSQAIIDEAQKQINAWKATRK